MAELTLEYFDKKLESLATKDDLKSFATKDDLKSFATKDDLKSFATKDDLKSFATKDDLKSFATKDDLKSFATKDDLKNLGEELKSYTDEKIEELAITIERTIVRELTGIIPRIETLEREMGALKQALRI